MRHAFSYFLAAVLAATVLSSCNLSTSSGGGSGDGGTSIGVKINKEESALLLGDTETLTAKITSYTNSESVYWEVEDSSIVSVGWSSGLVTARAVGTSNVIAYCYINGVRYTDSCKVTVSPIPPVEYTNMGYYKTGEITSTRKELWYHATVTPGKKYKVFLDDASDGSGKYTLDAKLYAYHPDKTTYYWLKSSSYLDNGYNNPGEISVPEGESELYIKVLPYFTSGTGTFAFALLEMVDSGTVIVTIE